MGLAFFDEFLLPDVPEKPRLGDAAGEWFRELVAATFGSWDPQAKVNYIRDIFCLAPKGSSKTSYGAGLALAVMLMNRRPRAEAQFIGPTQKISDRAYEQAVGMIEESPDLKRRFRTRDHIKTIEDLVTRSELKVQTFDPNIQTGSILIFAHLDEIHLLGRSPYASKVIRQIRGGLAKTPEGKFLITTTQSDDIPAGAFKEELIRARKYRDGHFDGIDVRPTLAVLYEFPEAIAKDPAQWKDRENWPMVQPNLGRSVHMKDLIESYNSEATVSEKSLREWASQYLNIEMGVGMKTDGWPGAEFWTEAEDESITLESMLQRCEVIVVCADGGGLDDLFGFGLIGRDRITKNWLAWSHAWCHRSVLDRRKTIASLLEQFAADGELTIVDDKLDDIAQMVAIIEKVKDAGLLACVALDPEGPYGELVDALAEIEITEEDDLIVGVPQGYKLMNAIKTTERKLANGTLKHAKSSLMDWCVGNVRIEPTATAIRATKQNAGDAKIDPWCALIDGATVMVRNPEAHGRSVYDELAAEGTQDAAAEAQSGDIDPAILADPSHPQWQEMRERWEKKFLSQDEAEFA